MNLSTSILENKSEDAVCALSVGGPEMKRSYSDARMFSARFKSWKESGTSFIFTLTVIIISLG